MIPEERPDRSAYPFKPFTPFTPRVPHGSEGGRNLSRIKRVDRLERWMFDPAWAVARGALLLAVAGLIAAALWQLAPDPIGPEPYVAPQPFEVPE